MNTPDEDPRDRGDCAEDGAVIEAEVLSDEESAEVARRLTAARAVAVRESGVLVRRGGLVLRRA
ncbi:MAG: hypothetical protein LC799_28775, partial [Actinobacteria bacterium]|nr:hypothetical protein [Actinomycetota bacterium]